MLKRLSVRYMAILVLVFALFVPAMPAAAAFDIHTGIDCSQATDSAVCQSTSTADPLTGSTGIIHKVTELIALIAGAAAIIVMVLAGFRYITSQGDPEEVSKAKKTIIFAAVGLVVIIGGQAIINFVLNKV